MDLNNSPIQCSNITGIEVLQGATTVTYNKS